ncbi:MAG: hypothetical protein K8S00_12205 [Bacteroidales bacterium]|nr:hypothetical protein [Bacteroidales bacterium]
MNDQVPYEKLNQDVKAWSARTKAEIRSRIASLSQKGKGELVKSLRVKYRKYYGMVDRITFTFDRHGVFLHYGVGRGYKREGGKVIRKIEKLPEGLSPKVMRKPKDWLNPTLDSRFDSLTDLVQKYYADTALVEASTLKSLSNG